MATYLTKAIQDAYEYAKQYELTLNEAAFAIAITRLINIAEKNETV
jgi:glutamate dehydrogenase/leucine dehydrogenase